MNKIIHTFTVQRGDGFAPLKYKSGEFIYKESHKYRGPMNNKADMELESKPLTEKEQQNKVEKEKKDDIEVRSAAINILAFLMLIPITLFVSSISEFAAACIAIWVSSKISNSLAIIVFMGIVLWNIF